MQRNVILQGDALSALRTLPDESVDMCMTSPPYWSLRDYGTEPLVWDGDPQCQHEWEDTNTRMHNGRGACKKGALYAEQEPIPDNRISYASCIKCGAWKGSLGLEPNPEMFIRHLCDISGFGSKPNDPFHAPHLMQDAYEIRLSGIGSCSAYNAPFLQAPRPLCILVLVSSHSCWH